MLNFSISTEAYFNPKQPDCDETHPSDGKRPVKTGPEQKGGIGRPDTGHGKRSIGNDGRGRHGHEGYRDRPQRPVEEQ